MVQLACADGDGGLMKVWKSLMNCGHSVPTRSLRSYETKKQDHRFHSHAGWNSWLTSIANKTNSRCAPYNLPVQSKSTLPFLPRVTIRSASLRSSFALATVVTMRSFSINCVTIVRSIAHRWEDVRPNFFHPMVIWRDFPQENARRQAKKDKLLEFRSYSALANPGRCSKYSEVQGNNLEQKANVATRPNDYKRYTRNFYFKNNPPGEIVSSPIKDWQFRRVTHGCHILQLYSWIRDTVASTLNYPLDKS